MAIKHDLSQNSNSILHSGNFVTTPIFPVFSYKKFNPFEEIEKELKRIAKDRSDITRLETIGNGP